MIVLAGGSGRTLAFAPGHVAGTPLPGEPGLSVIGGHRDTHFRVLKDMEPGTEIVVDDASGAQHRFTVTETRVVDSRITRLDPVEARPALALVTCWPFDAITPGGPMRYLVIAEPMDS